jgi:hypothetical protein
MAELISTNLYSNSNVLRNKFCVILYDGNEHMCPCSDKSASHESLYNTDPLTCPALLTPNEVHPDDIRHNTKRRHNFPFPLTCYVGPVVNFFLSFLTDAIQVPCIYQFWPALADCVRDLVLYCAASDGTVESESSLMAKISHRGVRYYKSNRSDSRLYAVVRIL